MRIHEILETCVEYVAHDGVVGSDPAKLIQHLTKIDPSLDYDYFSHIWSLLFAHPAIQVVLATYPLHSPGGTNYDGTAPLPHDYVPVEPTSPNLDLNALYREGVKGRQLAFMLAGEEFRTDRQAIEDKRVAQEKARLAKRKRAEDNVDIIDDDGDDNVKIEASTIGLLRVLTRDDGLTESDGGPISASDLKSLWARWGARLRLRCTDDEIYYRLTGSHQKISKVSSTVFHILQLSAMSREKGITAVELGPHVGASQGSMHYYMKVLLGLGLCAKIPAVIHGAITNLLIFHKYLDANPSYRASIGKEPHMHSTEVGASEPAADVTEGEKDIEKGDEEDEDDEPGDPSVDDSIPISEWGLNFTPLIESELAAGHVVKQRILRILDHPLLKNHLLRTKNLLGPLGWQGEHAMRHSRALRRHIERLVEDGQVERVQVGENKTICIRLAKYNAEAGNARAQPVSATAEEQITSEGPELDLEVIASRVPYHPPGGLALSLSFEYTINEVVARSGLDGATINILWRDTAFMYKRAIDFAILRADNAHVPAHLWPLSIASVMETIGKERRLRLFSIDAYQQTMISSGQPLSGFPALPRPASAGGWGDRSHKPFFSTVNQIIALLDSGKLYDPKYSPSASSRPSKKNSKPKGLSSSKQKANKQTGQNVEGSDAEESVKEKTFKYTSGPQIRGRPRKYVHVVEEDGRINRSVIGLIPSRSDLPPVLIYLKQKNILVEAPEGYSGVGAPPPIPDDAAQAGRPPEYYYQFPTHKAAMGAHLLAKENNAKKAKKGGKKKRAAKEADAISTPRKSKRSKKELDYKETGGVDDGDVEADNGSRDNAEERLNNIGSSTLPLNDNSGQDALIDPAVSDQGSPSIYRGLDSDGANIPPTEDQAIPADGTVFQPNAAAAEIRSSAVSAKKRGKSKKSQQIVDDSGNTPAQPKKARAPRKSQKTVTTVDLIASEPALVTEKADRTVGPEVPTATQSVVGVEATDDPAAIESATEKSVSEPTMMISADPPTTLATESAALEPLEDESVVATSTPAAADKTRGRKRKSLASYSPSHTPSRARSTRKKRGKVERSSTPGSTAIPSEAANVSSMFDFDASVIAEMPFELPADIMQAATPSRTLDQSVHATTLHPPSMSDEEPASIVPATPAGIEERPFELPFEIIEAATPIRERRANKGKKRGTKVEPDYQAALPAVSRKVSSTEVVALGGEIAPSTALVEPSQPPSASLVEDDTATGQALPSPSEPLRPPSPLFALPTSPVQVPVSEDAPLPLGMHPPAEPLVSSQKLSPALVSSRSSAPEDRSMLPPPSTPASNSQAQEPAEVLTPTEERVPSGAAIARERRSSQTPLREIDAQTSASSSKSLNALAKLSDAALTRRSQNRQPRVDIGMIRRTEELFQALVDGGGISTDLKIGTEHRAWADRVAGTDLPNAPKVAFTMDRGTTRRNLRTLLNDGRVKETSVSTPTSTGRWVKTTVIYTPSVAPADLQSYIRQMATVIQQNIAPAPRISATLGDTQFTEIRPSVIRGGNKVTTIFSRHEDSSSLRNPARPISERRLALLREINVVAQLYGWKSGRCVRAHTLHRAIIEAFCSASEITSMMSKSPRIFATPMLFEDISVDAYYACILNLQYDEDLDRWLQDPEHRKLKVKDIPKQFRPPGGFGGHTVRNKMATLLQILMQLKIISPLSQADQKDAQVFADRRDAGQGNGYKVATGVTWSTYYLVHDFSPIYHIASDPANLIGALPTQSVEDCDRYWSAMKIACLDANEGELAGGIETKKDEIGFPTAADLPGVLELSFDQVKMLQHRAKWRDELHLLPTQREALDTAIDYKTGARLVTERSKVEDLAYENALPPAYVEAELTRRSELAKQKAMLRADRIRENAARSKERQLKIQESLRVKMAEKQKADLEALETRIRHSAQQQDIVFDAEMLDFVRRQTVMTTRRSDLTDAQVDLWVRMWSQTKSMSTEEREAKIAERRMQAVQRARGQAPRSRMTRTKIASTKKAKDVSGATTQQRRTRSKRKWTSEDDDLLMDAEAIIRARSRTNKYLGRAAVAQLYPSMSPQTFANRLKAVKARPGKKAYLEKLEEAWYPIWIAHRGTAALSDEHFESSIDFPLQTHIDFLRENVDKRSLRLLAASIPAQQKPVPNLPLDIDNLMEEHKWNYGNIHEYSYDYYGDSQASEETRISHLATLSYVNDVKPTLTFSAAGVPNKDAKMREAAIKMIVGTPSATYDAVAGDRLLASSGSVSEVDDTMADMVQDGILKKTSSSSSAAMRSYDFTKEWFANGEGPLPVELIAEAESLNKKFAEADGHFDWPLIGQAGELAALMNMVSNHEIDFTYDVHEFPTIKYETTHYNTRKLNDDAYEFDLQVRRKAAPDPREQITSPSLAPALTSIGPPMAWQIPVRSDADTQRLAERVSGAVLAAGGDGMTKPDLVKALGCSTSSLNAALATLATETPARVFWAGYDTARLIAKEHQGNWTLEALVKQPQLRRATDPILLAQEDMIKVNPRKWSDIYGDRLEDEWKVAVNAVLTSIVTRPGMSERALREKVSNILDRLETNDVLSYLVQKGDISRTWISLQEDEGVPPPVEAVDLDEEPHIACWPSQHLWS